MIHNLTEINDSSYFLKEIAKLVIEYPGVDVSFIKQIENRKKILKFVKAYMPHKTKTKET